MATRPTDLVLVAGLALLAMIAALVGAPTAVRVLLAVPLVLMLPGYAVLAATIPGRPWPERLTFGLGLSLAISVLGGFVLHLSPWGLRPNAWTLVLGGLTLAAAALAFRRHGYLVAASATPRGRPSPYQALLLILAGMTATAALAVAVIGAQSQPWPGFTQLWLLPGGAATPPSAQLGIRNHEGQRTDYVLRVSRAGRVLAEQSISLDDGDGWEAVVMLPDGVTDEPLEVTLARGGAPGQVYRRVTLAQPSGSDS